MQENQKSIIFLLEQDHPLQQSFLKLKRYQHLARAKRTRLILSTHHYIRTLLFKYFKKLKLITYPLRIRALFKNWRRVVLQNRNKELGFLTFKNNRKMKNCIQRLKESKAKKIRNRLVTSLLRNVHKIHILQLFKVNYKFVTQFIPLLQSQRSKNLHKQARVCLERMREFRKKRVGQKEKKERAKSFRQSFLKRIAFSQLQNNIGHRFIQLYNKYLVYKYFNMLFQPVKAKSFIVITHYHSTLYKRYFAYFSLVHRQTRSIHFHSQTLLYKGFNALHNYKIYRTKKQRKLSEQKLKIARITHYRKIDIFRIWLGVYRMSIEERKIQSYKQAYNQIAVNMFILKRYWKYLRLAVRLKQSYRVYQINLKWKCFISIKKAVPKSSQIKGFIIRSNNKFVRQVFKKWRQTLGFKTKIKIFQKFLLKKYFTLFTQVLVYQFLQSKAFSQLYYHHKLKLKYFLFLSEFIQTQKLEQQIAYRQLGRKLLQKCWKSWKVQTLSLKSVRKYQFSLVWRLWTVWKIQFLSNRTS